MNWNILTTDPRKEFVVAASLIAHGVNVYLPSYRVHAQAPPNTRITFRLVARPMFPGYLFARMARNEAWEAAHASAGYSGYLRCGNKPATLSEAAIELVREMEKKLAIITKNKKDKYQVGDRVLIDAENNPWRGLTGIVKKIDKNDEVLIGMMYSTNEWRVSVPASMLKNQ